jgi:hypothetical protein
MLMFLNVTLSLTVPFYSNCSTRGTPGRSQRSTQALKPKPLRGLQAVVLQSGIELPYRAIKSNIADSLNVLIQLERRPGKRFVSEVLEIHGYDSENDRYDLSSAFAVQL